MHSHHIETFYYKCSGNKVVCDIKIQKQKLPIGNSSINTNKWLGLRHWLELEESLKNFVNSLNASKIVDLIDDEFEELHLSGGIQVNIKRSEKSHELYKPFSGPANTVIVAVLDVLVEQHQVYTDQLLRNIDAMSATQKSSKNENAPYNASSKADTLTNELNEPAKKSLDEYRKFPRRSARIKNLMALESRNKEVQPKKRRMTLHQEKCPVPSSTPKIPFVEKRRLTVQLVRCSAIACSTSTPKKPSTSSHINKGGQSATKTNLPLSEISEDVQQRSEDFRKLNQSTPGKVAILTLTDKSLNEILGSFEEFKSILDEIFEQNCNEGTVKTYKGIDHIKTQKLLKVSTQLKVMHFLKDHYQPDTERIPFLSHFYINAMLSEWTIRIFMRENNFTRDEAIKQLDDQTNWSDYCMRDLAFEDI